MSYTKEFETVDLLENSSAETCGVDAFAISLIKTERQIRKLFTYLMFQFPAFSATDFAGFRGALADNKNVYFKGFINGIDNLYPNRVEDLIGAEYVGLLADLELARDYRNKIFHGQLTKKNLTRDDLFDFVLKIRKWCETLTTAAQAEFGYDGFARNSLQKSGKPIYKNYRVFISSLDEYRDFIRKHMEG